MTTDTTTVSVRKIADKLSQQQTEILMLLSATRADALSPYKVSMMGKGYPQAMRTLLALEKRGLVADVEPSSVGKYRYPEISCKYCLTPLGAAVQELKRPDHSPAAADFAAAPADHVAAKTAVVPVIDTTTDVLDLLAEEIAVQRKALARIPAELGEEYGPYNPAHAVPSAILDGCCRAFTATALGRLQDEAERIAQARGVEIDPTQPAVSARARDLADAGFAGGSAYHGISVEAAAQEVARMLWIITDEAADRERAEMIGADLEVDGLAMRRLADPRYVVASWAQRLLPRAAA